MKARRYQSIWCEQGDNRLELRHYENGTKQMVMEFIYHGPLILDEDEFTFLIKAIDAVKIREADYDKEAT